MEESQQKGDVSSPNRTEEESPPTETDSDCNHTTEAGSPVAMETNQNQDPAVTLQTPKGGTVVVEGGNKNPASEKLERVRKWSVSKYKCTRQALAERLGRGSRTVDLDLEPRLELLRDDRQRYDHMTKLAQTLSNQLAQFAVTQKSLGDVFTELSVKSQKLHVEFSLNAEAQKFLSKSGDTLTTAINSFTSDMNTLVNKTIEDTMVSAKQYEAARIEYDAYRVDLEELNMGPRDTTTVPKLEQAQKVFQGQRERYQKVRDDLSVKIKLVEENRVKVLHNHLLLLHSAVASHCLSCHSFLQHNMQQAADKLQRCTVDQPSWLEDS
ncbi:arfaptin-1 [Austrofundulus limnaeus]|uniref:Arfaptin-1 n=1 Tax=Austrofundulus limnaeus TaxID=52670 RepID=A0A2I4CDA8_AUSLI|nr:PREDICTED: arfaptin-1-like [Austrofundulus limnaeus]